MGIIITVLAILGFAMLFAYIQFPPPYADKKLINTFNVMTIGVCAFICLMWALNVRSIWAVGVSEKWWKAIAIAGALGIETLFLGICFVLRNFWVFKPPRRPGGL